MTHSRVLDITDPESGQYIQDLLSQSDMNGLSDLEKDAVNGLLEARTSIHTLNDSLQKMVLETEKQIEYHQGQLNAFFIQLISEENRRRRKNEDKA